MQPLVSQPWCSTPGLGIGVRDPGIGHLGEFMINDSGAAIYFFYVFGVFAAPLVVALFWTAAGCAIKSFWSFFLPPSSTSTPGFLELIDLICGFGFSQPAWHYVCGV